MSWLLKLTAALQLGLSLTLMWLAVSMWRTDKDLTYCGIYLPMFVVIPVMLLAAGGNAIAAQAADRGEPAPAPRLKSQLLVVLCAAILLILRIVPMAGKSQHYSPHYLQEWTAFVSGYRPWLLWLACGAGASALLAWPGEWLRYRSAEAVTD